MGVLPQSDTGGSSFSQGDGRDLIARVPGGRSAAAQGGLSMGLHIIKMPDIGEGIAEVELVEWHVQAGDSVSEDQILADVMTDKATVQVPSPVDGKVLALGGKVGEVMAVGSDLVRLEIDGATPAASPEDENSLEADGKHELAESGQSATESVQIRQAI